MMPQVNVNANLVFYFQVFHDDGAKNFFHIAWND